MSTIVVEKRVSALRIVLPAPTRPNERWSIVFFLRPSARWPRFRAVTLVDPFPRASPAIEVGNPTPGRRVVAVLDRLAETHGLPQAITTDNGTEFASRAVDEWAHRNGVKLDFIRPGKPIENAEIESFHGRPRQEFLKENWFMSLEDAKMKIKTGARTATSTGPTAV